MTYVFYVVLPPAEFEQFPDRKKRDRPWSIAHRSIEGFAPAPTEARQPVLYMDDAHLNALNYFFNEANGYETCIGEFDDSTIEAKLAFLGNRLPVSPQHWTSGYHFYSFPHVRTIAFLDGLEKAKIAYRDSWHTGGVDDYRPTDTGWIRTGIIDMWIE